MTVESVSVRCFCVRLSLLSLVGWFLDLKSPGKIAARHSACAPSGHGPNRVLCPEFLGFKCWKISLALQVVETSVIARFGQGEKNVKIQVKLGNRCMSVET